MPEKFEKRNIDQLSLGFSFWALDQPVHQTQLVYSPLQLIHDQAHVYHLLPIVTHQGQKPLLRFLHLADAVVVQNACSSSLQPAKIVKLHLTVASERALRLCTKGLHQ